MKFIFPFLGMALLIMLVASGCGVGDIGPLNFEMPPNWDSLWVGSVSLTLSTSNVTYSAGATGEVGGDVRVTNSHGVPLCGNPVGICVSDSQVHIVYWNPTLQDTTGSDGHVRFTLRTTQSGGRVWISATSGYPYHSDSKMVVFSRQDRQPTYLSASAVPETLYFDSQHLMDSTFIRIVVLDGQSHPIPGFNVECSLLGREFNSCSDGIAQTNSTGNVTYHSYPQGLSWPHTQCFAVRAGALIDSLCLTFMPWDSRRGG